MMLMISLFILILLGLWVFATYNRFIRSRALLDEGWSGIDVQLKRRYDLIPNLVEIVKGYATHEKTIFNDIATMRAASMGATTVAEKADAEAGLTKTLKSLFAIAENYPDLKANQNFLDLQNQLNTIESELQLSRRYYNGTARNFNILVQSFPSNLIASLAHFEKAAYFEATSGERENVQIKF